MVIYRELFKDEPFQHGDLVVCAVCVGADGDRSTFGKLAPERYFRRATLFTVGEKSTYDNYLATDPHPCKAAGGSVWLTQADAKRHLTPGFEVYGVLAEWDVDTQPVEGADWHALLKNAKLVKLSL